MKQLLMTSLGALIRIAEIEYTKLAIHRSLRVALLGLCAAITGFGAALCLLAALWTFAKPQLGAGGASLAVAGVLLVITLVLVLIARRPATPTIRPAYPAAALPADRTIANRHAIAGPPMSNTRAEMTGLATAVVGGFIAGMMRPRR